MNLILLGFLVGKYASSTGESNELFYWTNKPKMDVGFTSYCTGRTPPR